MLKTNILKRCDAHHSSLDAPGAHRRCHEKTDFLLSNFDPGILWDEYGIRDDVVVSQANYLLMNVTQTMFAFSLIHIASHVQIYINCLHPTFFTGSSRESSRITSLNGSMST